MKRVEFKKSFDKQYKKPPLKIQKQFDTRLVDYMENPNYPHLKCHNLKEKLLGFKSLNVSGDIRALFLEDGDTLIIFYMIGTHSELY